MGDSPTLRELIQHGRQQLPVLEVRALLRHILQCPASWLIAHDDAQLTAAQLSAYQTLLQRRVDGQPLAYLVGYREFFGREFHVAPGVLIPRADTEILVETALEKLTRISQPHLLDLGTGSGILAITLAKEIPAASVTAVDASPAALAIAEKNAAALDARVTFILSDWFNHLPTARYDLIVSNPPYIRDQDPHLAQGDLPFEPLSALASGADGFNDLRRIIAQAEQYLAPQGWLLLEHGYDQASEVRQLLSQHGFTSVQSWCDLAGIERVSGGQCPKLAEY